MSKLPRNSFWFITEAKPTNFYNALTEEIYKWEAFHIQERFSISMETHITWKFLSLTRNRGSMEMVEKGHKSTKR